MNMNTKMLFKWLFFLTAIFYFDACTEEATSDKTPGEIIAISLKDANDNDVRIEGFESDVKGQTVTVLVPGPTNLKSLTPYFTLNDGATLLYNSSIAYDGKSMSFTKPVYAQVKGSNGAVIEYKLTVKHLGRSGYISDVTFEGLTPEKINIDQEEKSIDIIFAKGAALKSLKPFFVIHEDAVLQGDIPNGGERDMSNPIIVSILGENEALTEYTVGVWMPELTLDKEMFRGKISDASSSLVVCGDKLVVLADFFNYQYLYMDLVTGEYEPEDKLIPPTVPTGHNAQHLRKFVSDDKGVLLSMHLSIGVNLVAYKWDDLTATPTIYIDYPWPGGVTARVAGLTLTGDLSANAKIIFLSTNKKMLTFTVENGVLNPAPVITDVKTEAPSLINYSSIIPVVGTTDFVLTLGETTMRSEYYNSNGDLMFTIGGHSSNGKTFDYDGRKYLALATTDKSRNVYNIFDISDPTNVTKSSTPIFREEFTCNAGNGNTQIDADYTIIDGQLYVYFTGVGTSWICYRFK
jgi:hypothetical protein